MKDALNQSKHKEHVFRTAIDNLSNELKTIKNQLMQANKYIQTQDSQCKSLQSEMESAKSLNLELKSQLERTMFSSTQPIPSINLTTSYKPPPKFETAYVPPPQFTYTSPSDMLIGDTAFPNEMLYDYDGNSALPGNELWDIDEHVPAVYSQAYKTADEHDREHRGREESTERVRSHSYEFKPTGVSSGVMHAYQKHIHHNQSTMGSLLAWTGSEDTPQRDSSAKRAQPGLGSEYKARSRDPSLERQSPDSQW